MKVITLLAVAKPNGIFGALGNRVDVEDCAEHFAMPVSGWTVQLESVRSDRVPVSGLLLHSADCITGRVA